MVKYTFWSMRVKYTQKRLLIRILQQINISTIVYSFIDKVLKSMDLNFKSIPKN